jgi:hypothetical protein
MIGRQMEKILVFETMNARIHGSMHFVETTKIGAKI